MNNLKHFDKSQKLIKQVCESDENLRLFVDMLSQLEYVGARKILKSVGYLEMDEHILQHLSEEAGHAHFLKSAAAKLGASGQTWKQNPLGPVGFEYFHTLDTQISSHLADQKACYPMVSWTVEQRVVEVYELLLHHVSQVHLQRVLKLILGQEKRHSHEMELKSPSRILQSKMLEIEAPLWETFCQKVQSVLEDQSVTEEKKKISARSQTVA